MLATDFFALRDAVMTHEGLSLLAKPDAKGSIQIGYGRNLTFNGITRTEAQYLLENDLQNCIMDCEKLLPGFRSLDGPRQRVLVEMCYMLGIGGLLRFERMLADVAAGDFKAAGQEILASALPDQVGARAQFLAGLMAT